MKHDPQSPIRLACARRRAAQFDARIEAAKGNPEAMRKIVEEISRWEVPAASHEPRHDCIPRVVPLGRAVSLPRTHRHVRVARPQGRRTRQGPC